MTDQPEKLDLKSMDLAAEKQAELLRLFPEIRTEGGKIDFDRLKLALGETVDAGRERYGLNWPGKADCFKTIQAPSLGTLRPARDESVNFDTTENLIIEGDNLEVLKLLQKSYLGKIKMIYIDPPYNTGNEFIYPDNFKESLQTYLEYTKQIDGEGREFSTNTESDGRFHSKWLSMMYPRLYLARNLLREDGVFFVSIDDHEIDNLKSLCSQIFGEENFLGCFVVNSTPNARDYGHIGKMHEYALFYAKDALETKTFELPSEDKVFRFNDEKSGFKIHPLYNSNVAFHKDNRPNLFYPFYLNKGQKSKDGFFEISLDKKEGLVEIYPPKSLKEGIQFVWRWGKDLSKSQLNQEIVGYETENGEFRVVQKMRHTTKIIRSLLSDKSYSSRRGTAQLEELFGKKIFSFPKPVDLIRDFIQASTEDGDTVLDFFSGSATTGHALIEQSREDGKKRSFILVQLPEPNEQGSDAIRDGYKTLADIGKERINRLIKNINEERSGELSFNADGSIDLGFRVFKLDQSNFMGWDAGASTDAEALGKQLDLSIDHVRQGRSDDDLFYELLLKSGFPLTTPVEKLNLSGKVVYSIGGGVFLICLERDLTSEAIKAMADLKPSRVVCLDDGFRGNDQLKTNAVLTFKAKGVAKFQTV